MNGGEPSALWSEAYEAVGPSRDDMWDWLEAKYLAERAVVAAQREAIDLFRGRAEAWLTSRVHSRRGGFRLTLEELEALIAARAALDAEGVSEPGSDSVSESDTVKSGTHSAAGSGHFECGSAPGSLTSPVDTEAPS